MHSIQCSMAAVLCCAMLSSAAEGPIGRSVKYSRYVQKTAKGGEDSFIPDEKGLVPDARLDRPIGRIDIPRVGVSSVILEGADHDTLALCVGHVHGTALLGSDGNVALAAHRDTFFRGLEYIRVGDHIVLTSIGGDRHYQVDSTLVVAPTDISVLKETAAATLTLITCFPFHYAGPAPKRFIVRAHLIRP
jgi:LPXTG-site transpeptidase (sortase) family protein